MWPQERFTFILKTKMNCLNNLHTECFQCLWQHLKKILMKLNFFEQYRQMWKNIWYFLQENPTILSNLKQYESLPNFKDICKNVKNCRWDLFCHQAQKAGLLAELSEDILFLLSLKTAINLASDAKFIDFDLKPEILESVIERSWRAIQK